MKNKTDSFNIIAKRNGEFSLEKKNRNHDVEKIRDTGFDDDLAERLGRL